MPNKIILEERFWGNDSPNVEEGCDCHPNPQHVITGPVGTANRRTFSVKCNFCPNSAKYTYERQDDGSWLMVDDD